MMRATMGSRPWLGLVVAGGVAGALDARAQVAAGHLFGLFYA